MAARGGAVRLGSPRHSQPLSVRSLHRPRASLCARYTLRGQTSVYRKRRLLLFLLLPGSSPGRHFLRGASSFRPTWASVTTFDCASRLKIDSYCGPLIAVLLCREVCSCELRGPRSGCEVDSCEAFVPMARRFAISVLRSREYLSGGSAVSVLPTSQYRLLPRAMPCLFPSCHFVLSNEARLSTFSLGRRSLRK